MLSIGRRGRGEEGGVGGWMVERGGWDDGERELG